MEYVVIYEPTDTGWSAYLPDLPGCVSTGASREEIELNIRAAVAVHVEGLRELGQEVPPPLTQTGLLPV
jgi:predicted RNase H-like HicB family nuclease